MINIQIISEYVPIASQVVGIGTGIFGIGKLVKKLFENKSQCPSLKLEFSKLLNYLIIEKHQISASNFVF